MTKILIVEDEKAIAEVEKAYVLREGYEADIASDGAEALRMFNEGNYDHFPEGVKVYIDYCKQQDKPTQRPYSARYIGSLVADFHRNLLKGGIFLYPPTAAAPNGKLRLTYECNPIAFIAEQAGGTATDGSQRILDIKPESLHQRVPFYVGSSNMVGKLQEFIDKHE